MTEKIGGEEVEIIFSEYNHVTQRERQVERPLTLALKTQIEMIMQEYASGCFTELRVGDVTVTGYFEIVNTGI